MATAIIAAAIADFLVEFAANSGWFGRGTFTDRSNLDVAPALILGFAFMALVFVRKARAILDGRAGLRRVMSLLPAIFVLQMAMLYAMETAEQLVVWHHALGPGLWLGGPAPLSVTIHAGVCLTVAMAFVRSRRRLAATTLYVIRLIRAFARVGVAMQTRAGRPVDAISFIEFLPILGAVGERAPPILP